MRRPSDNRRAQAVVDLLRTARYRAEEELFARGPAKAFVHVAEFPKSGGTWISEMVRDLARSNGSGLRGRFDAARVIHHHARYRTRSHPAVYVIRDGRDIVVSLYFHHLRELTTGSRWAPRVSRYFTEILGPGADPTQVGPNLPAFISSLNRYPMGGLTRASRNRDFLSWPQHIDDWASHRDVHVVHYEKMLEDPLPHLSAIARYLNLQTPAYTLHQVIEMNSFEARTGRPRGTEDQSSFRRKGIAGDWRRWFTVAAGEAFSEYGGRKLEDLGYEHSRAWLDTLPAQIPDLE